jgi:thiol-disulfide isomerase/thioredoxin
MKIHNTFILGVLSPGLAAVLGTGTYAILTGATHNRDTDFVFRLAATSLVMTVPFAVTVWLTIKDRSRSQLGKPSKIGLAVATLSLGLLWVPITGGIQRARQAANLSMSGVPSPEMATPDINGQIHRLSEHTGKVLLVNMWATWCGPCRKEMPALDRLYQDRREQGFLVFGISNEDIRVVRDFSENFPVSYPLLTVNGEVPEIFRTTARYPANFLIDRHGMLRSAPSTDQPFENLVKIVDELLAVPAP